MFTCNEGPELASAFTPRPQAANNGQSREVQFSSVQSLSRVRLFVTHESQHTRPPCPSPTPGVHPNSCPSSRWCHPAISSSVIPFSSCPQSLPASGSFPMSQLFAWGGQSTGVSASASVFPKNTQDWSPLEWTGVPQWSWKIMWGKILKRGQRGFLHRELASGNVSLKQMYHLFQETSPEGETKVRHWWEKMTGVRESPVVDFPPLGFSLKSQVILVSYT